MGLALQFTMSANSAEGFDTAGCVESSGIMERPDGTGFEHAGLASIARF
jgi:hypothetical protein